MADITQIDKGYSRVFDPDSGTTSVWDSNGLKGKEIGNTEKLGSLTGPIDSANQVPNIVPPGFSKDKSGNVTLGSIVQDLIPAAATALVPEFKGLSPAANVASRMGASTAAGTVLDQIMSLINGQDKPLLNSVAGAGSNALAGIGLPELLNVGPTISPYGTKSVRVTTPSTSESTRSSASSGSSAGTSEGTSSGTSVGSTQGTSSSATQGSSASHTTGINDVAASGMSKSLSHSDAVKLGFQPSDQVTETIRIDPETKRFVKAYTVVKNVPREGQYQTNTTVDQNGTSNYDRISKAIFGSDTEGTSQSSTQGSTAGGSQSERQGSTTGQRQGSTQGTTQSQRTTVNTPGVSTLESTAGVPWWAKIMQMVGSKQYNVRGTGQPNLSPLQTALLGLGINLNKNQDQQ